MARVSMFLIAVALIAGMVGCVPASQKLEIRTWYDLDAVRDALDGHYVLMNDLDSTTPGYEELVSPTADEGKGWQPIGTTGEQFTGRFDGQEHQIRDLFINRPEELDVGLFGCVWQGGSITNLGVVDATVTGYMWVAGLVAGNDGTVSNSYSASSVTGTDYVGGLVGANGDRGTVSNSYSIGNVTGNSAVGGLVGQNNGSVTGCHATGGMTSEGGCVGGLVGENYGGTVSDSYATGSVSVTGTTAGGLVGENNYDGTVSYSYSTGNVAGEAWTGGLVGINWGIVINSYSTGSVTGDLDVGGLVGGNANPGTVMNSYSTGSVTGNQDAGGLVGINSLDATVTDSFWDTQTSGQAASAGGIGKTTVEMQNIATFSGVGWNIIAVALNQTDAAYMWNIVNNVTYPFLSWQS